MAQETAILRYARYYADKLGWCVIPIPHGRKKARIKWGKYQKVRPNHEQVQKWFGNGRASNMAVVLGTVSGGLTCRDFDVAESYTAWANTHPDLAGLLATVRTRKGYHVYFQADWDGIKHLGDGELRSTGGYCLLPPSVHPEGPIYEWIIRPTVENLVVLDPEQAGFLTNGAHVTEQTEQTEAYRANISNVWGEGVEEAVRETLPREYGTRNRKVFEFARALKSLPQFADAEPQALRDIVKVWHSRALPSIRTKDLAETWIDFLKAWPRIRHPKGEGPMTTAFERATRTKPPSRIISRYPDNPKLHLLGALCRELQKAAGSGPFYLASRTAGGLLEVSHTQANRWLFLLVADGILAEVEKGGTPERPRSATRFRYVGD